MGNSRKTIFLVDDNVTNLVLGKNILGDAYNIFTLNSGKRLFKMLEKIIPDLILLDVEMPEMNGYDVIKVIKEKEQTAQIPVIFLTAKSDADSELKGLSLGAIDYIVKPFSPPLLLKRIEVHLLVESQKQELQEYNDNLQEMVEAKTKTVLELQNSVLETVAELVESRDDITGGHIERTKNYLSLLANGLLSKCLYMDEVSSWNMEQVLLSALLHDVGKIAIKDSILQKPGKLTPEEFEEMKAHTTFGIKIIDKIIHKTTEHTFLEHAKVLAGTHHEKWDGTGYPVGLKGEAIPLEGRLMAIADVYDALVSERPYKRAFPHEKAVEIIKEGGGTHFDPSLVEVFLVVAEQFNEVAAALRSEGQGAGK